MKIIFDPIIFLLQKYGGISRYYSEILKVIVTRNEFQVEFPLLYSDNLHLNNYRIGNNIFFRKCSNFLPLRFKEYLKRKSVNVFIQKLQQSRFDLIIPTYYDKSFLDIKGKVPFVLTVYDMIHENYPELERDSSIVSDKKLLIEKADAVIAISQYTKKDIIRFYPHIPKEKIHVVYLSHSIFKKEFDSQFLIKSVGYSKYILFVGNRGFYKNFTWLLINLSSWLKSNDINLLCLGGGSLSRDELDLISNLELSDKVSQFTFQDDELYFFYKNALAFIFPSEYEGFGIPVLEAMYSGCPVILPRLTSFPEVAGDAGEYFDLENADSLVNSLIKINEDVEYRENLIKKGFVQASKFSWEKTVNQCFDIYKSVVK